MAHPLARALVQWSTRVLLPIVAFTVYGAVAEHRARTKAREFCIARVPGMSYVLLD